MGFKMSGQGKETGLRGKVGKKRKREERKDEREREDPARKRGFDRKPASGAVKNACPEHESALANLGKEGGLGDILEVKRIKTIKSYSLNEESSR